MTSLSVIYLTLDRESEIRSLKLLQVTMNQRQEQYKENSQPRPVMVSLGQAFIWLGGPWEASLPNPFPFPLAPW